MSDPVGNLKAAVDFRALASETHEVGREDKVLCPAHGDTHPSCHIYPDGYKCFACGAYGDHITWLELIHNLSTAEAIKELKRRADGYVAPATPRTVKPTRPVPTLKPVAESVLEAHRRQAENLDRVPLAMQGRGFAIDDLKRLSVAARSDDAVLPISGPDGTVLALKRRYSAPKDGVRYRYEPSGHGTPAWCSPDFLKAETVLVVEGELNGAACWLACPELGVMGVAGTGGGLHLDAFRGRTVYVYADADDPGQKARGKWAALALSAGAVKVFVLTAWLVDACDLAGSMGRGALAEALTGNLETAAPVTVEADKTHTAACPKSCKPKSYRARVFARMRGQHGRA